ncbi:MAG TPA: hypothetical protein VFM97_07465 [Gammaproteobacteria bacterium]|nr:hypothetical protein [Gammaproteobacteria bacterium]
MKLSRMALLGAAMALSLPLALPAVASNHDAYQKKMTKMSHHSQWTAMRTVHNAKVQSVDQSTGIVKVSARGNEEMTLHFPPSALKNVKEGDKIALMYGYATSKAGTNGTESGSSSSRHGAMHWQGAHTMPATVKNVDAKKGQLTVDSEGKQLVLAFPQSSLQKLKEGEQIQVHMALRDTSATKSSIAR